MRMAVSSAAVAGRFPVGVVTKNAPDDASK
jgi:hypothetical protein